MKYTTYREKLRELEALKDEIAALERDPEIIETMDFLSKVSVLMQEYGVSPEGVRDILCPPDKPASQLGKSGKSKAHASNPPQIHARRHPVEYRNPYTGEVLKTRDPRNPTLKEWRDKYGMSEVVNWKV